MPAPATSLELPAHVSEYVSSRDRLTLSTASPSAAPHASTYLYVNEGATLYFWTKPVTTTARNVERNPSVAFTIDDPVGADLEATRGVQGTGECSVLLDGEQIARVAHLFGEKYPQLAPGNTLSIAFFKISPVTVAFIGEADADGASREGAFGAEFHREPAYNVFADLPHREVEDFAATLRTLRVGAGDVVVRQGTPADKFFVVVAGAVEVLRDGEPDGETFGPGQLFGEMAVLSETPRRATVRAQTSSTLLALERDVLRDLMAQALGTTTDFDALIRTRLGVG